MARSAISPVTKQLRAKLLGGRRRFAAGDHVRIKIVSSDSRGPTYYRTPRGTWHQDPAEAFVTSFASVAGELRAAIEALPDLYSIELEEVR